jgi:hypothetical protein
MLKYYCDVCGSEVEGAAENIALFYNVPKGGIPLMMSGIETIKMKEVDVVRFPFVVCSQCLSEKPIIQIMAKLAIEKIPEAWKKEKFLELRWQNITLKRKGK